MATWARGVNFKNSTNTKNIGGIGVYGTDTAAQKLYIGLGTEPWNNAGLQLTSSAINFKGNKIYHAGDKPTLSELGAAASNHNHNGIYVNDKANVSGNMNNAAGYRNALGMINLSGTDATINPNGQTGWHHFINMSYSESSGSNMWQTQIANKAGTTDLWVRSRAGSEITDGTAWAAPWTRILTGSNYKSIVTPANIGAAPTSTGGNITLHADSDSSSTAEYVLIKAGHNELKVASSAGGSTVTKGADKITFNGSVVYHAGYKPSKSDVGLGSVNNWGASSDVAANSTSQYATTNMVAKVRAEKANISHTHNYAAASHTHGLLHDTMIVEIPSTTTDNGWSMLNSSYNGFLLKSIRTNANAPSWILGNYSAGIVFGGADTKGVLSMGYSSPSIKFAGGNGTKPVWNMALTGSSGKTYNMESLSANTANTLATARTINGTSFNGSANITTSNWGTARTITIGNTGKSVNGGSNVTWTLSEIGAAAASHSHSYLPLSGGTITGALTSSVTTGTHLAGNKGTAIINSTAIGSSYNMLAKMNSTNGVWTMGSWGTSFCVFYTANSIINAGTNSYTKRLTLLDESGNSSFPGTVSASSFSGSLSGNASTATTLQTARTINGTSFNGSGNITTANWGTARTITVGSTAKSVNGSANIGWTLAEIGAVPSYTGGSTTIHADSDASSTSEYLLLKAGHNELKIASSAGGTTVTKGQDKLTFNGNIVYHAGRKPTASEIGAAASSHSHSYLPLSGGTITSNGFTIKTTTATDSSGYITFQDTSGKRRAYITSNSGSSGIKIHTYDSAGTWKSNFVIEEDGSVHIGNGYLKAISEIWGRESSINLNIKKGTGFQGGARFNWTGATNIGAPRFQMIPMDSYDLRVGSPENPIHVVYGRVGYVTTSDREAKTNIHYIDDMQPLGLTNKTSVDEVKTLTKDDFYNFFKDEIRFASYDFKEANLENLETNLGFMAQDIADTKVGSKIVIPPREKIEYYHEDGTITEEKVDNGMYSFSTTNFASATAIALQKAIEKIEILENQIALLNEKLGL